MLAQVCFLSAALVLTDLAPAFGSVSSYVWLLLPSWWAILRRGFSTALN